MKTNRIREAFRLFRATYKDRAGQQRESALWYAAFRDHQRIMRRWPLFSDRRASEALARQLVRLAADVAVNGRLTDPDLLRAVAGWPDALRGKLVASGMLEAEAGAITQQLSALLDSWRDSLVRAGDTERHARLQRNRAGKLALLCGFKRLSDIRRQSVESVLSRWHRGELEGERRISTRTHNAIGQALVGFCKWAVRNGLLRENPLNGLNRLAVTDEQERDALSIEEQARLVAAAENGPIRHGISGPERALLYRVALGTGLRAAELAALTVGDFDLTDDPPVVRLGAGHTKNRRTVVQPIPADLAAILRPRLAAKLASARALPTARSDATARIFRADLAAARAQWLAEAATADERAERERSDFLAAVRHNGLALCFHSLRHSYVANLKRGGVPLATAMQLARHSDPKLTAKRYGTLGLRDLQGALEALPDLGAVLAAKMPCRAIAQAGGASYEPIKTGKAAPARPTAGPDRPDRATPEAHAVRTSPESVFAFCLPKLSGSEQTSVDSGRLPSEPVPCAWHSDETRMNKGENAQSATATTLNERLTEKPPTRPVRFERTTCGLGNRCSILLSYGRRVGDLVRGNGMQPLLPRCDGLSQWGRLARPGCRRQWGRLARRVPGRIRSSQWMSPGRLQPDEK